MKAANLPTLLKFGNANKSDICVIFAKNYGWPRNWGGGWSKNWGPGLKLLLGSPRHFTFLAVSLYSDNDILICSFTSRVVNVCVWLEFFDDLPCAKPIIDSNIEPCYRFAFRRPIQGSPINDICR